MLDLMPAARPLAPPMLAPPDAGVSAAAGRVSLTRIGGPTVVLDVAGLRLVVDPTFDPPAEYPIGARSLVKTAAPALRAEQIGRVDAVLLSHDQHPDNLDHAGREFAERAPLVLTTPTAAARLGGNARGLAPWARAYLTTPLGDTVTVVAVPAQHGPPGTEHLTGPVTGFVLYGRSIPTTYVSGDNASLDAVRLVAEHFARVDIAVLFAGGAKTALLGDAYLTLSSAMAATAVRVLRRPRTVVVHADSWAHFSEPLATIEPAFTAAGVADVLVDAPPGTTVAL
jgi:L-ascorbate metabolism protein UlaG (beta-lactamase superfamily)